MRTPTAYPHPGTLPSGDAGVPAGERGPPDGATPDPHPRRGARWGGQGLPPAANRPLPRRPSIAPPPTVLWAGRLKFLLGYALRLLRTRPGFALAVILTLSVGIGAGTSIFSILQGTVLRPLPYPEPDRLIFVRGSYLPTGGGGPNSVPNYLDMQEQVRSVCVFAGYAQGAVNLATDEAPVRASTIYATDNFLDALGARAALGRGFLQGEDREGAALAGESWLVAEANRRLHELSSSSVLRARGHCPRSVGRTNKDLNAPSAEPSGRGLQLERRRRGFPAPRHAWNWPP